jgi:hypothetical protein
MTADARLLHVKLRTLLGGAAAGRKLVSRRTDGDVHAAEFFGGWRASHAIGGATVRTRSYPAAVKLRQPEACSLPMSLHNYARPLLTLPSLAIFQGMTLLSSPGTR